MQSPYRPIVRFFGVINQNGSFAKELQDKSDRFYAEKGITTEIVETVLPISGGTGFKLQYYKHGVPINNPNN